MSYLVLARKYRPQSFEDLVGQDHVARTLANAIASGRIAHAFLFTGVRGVGKTTSARLLAKCLNCVGADGTQKGPTSTPCQVCGPCKEIALGADIDVQEIDGASYNGVDEVRRLQEGINFRPARDRFKIYIVDEVHMLSNAAWNAFLKTLEEPPPHVKFIFATTEVHKVPVTILSRCQRYDFKLISAQTIAGRLRQVLSQEAIEADDAAVSVLAREAAGSMRDAMSLLDQVIAFSGTKLSGEDVARVLGVADRTILHELAGALVSGDAKGALDVVHRLAQQGFDLPHVAKDVLRHLRNLVVAKVCGTDSRELLDLADEELKDVQELAGRADADDLTRLFQGFSRAYDDICRSGQPRAALEMALVRLARRPPLLPLDELLARLGELERRVSGGAPPPAPRGGGGGGGGARPGAVASAFAANVTPAPVVSTPSWGPEAERTHGALALAQTAPEAQRAAAASPVVQAAPAVQPPAAASPVVQAAPAVQRPAAASPVVQPGPSAVPALRSPSAKPAAKTAAPGAPHAAAEAAGSFGPTASSAGRTRRPEATPAELGAWGAIVAKIRAVHPPLGAVYEHAVPLEMNAERVLLGYDAESLLATQASEPEALELLRREVRAHFGPTTQVAIDLSTRRGDGERTLASIESDRRRKATAAARSAVEQHPLVREAIAVFGAELRDVRLPKLEEEAG